MFLFLFPNLTGRLAINELKGNKGEWSEIYVFLKLLGEGSVSGYPVIAILRDDICYKRETTAVLLYDTDTMRKIAEFPVSDFIKFSNILLKTLISSKGTFSVPELTTFLNKLGCLTLKAKSKDKADIRIVLHDKDTFTDTEFGFSIKSYLGSSSTLLNAGKTTNFIYRISEGFTDHEARQINGIHTRSKIKDRITALSDKGYTVNYYGMENSDFEANLIVIDSNLPHIISHMLLLFFSGKRSSVKELATLLTKRNICGYPAAERPYYEYKLKNFLYDIALGMTPSTPWTGHPDATGGYIIVNNIGELSCYHSYGREKFQEYLFTETKLDTASSSRHEFGLVYKDNNRYFIKLNLQIRFT